MFTYRGQSAPTPSPSNGGSMQVPPSPHWVSRCWTHAEERNLKTWSTTGSTYRGLCREVLLWLVTYLIFGGLMLFFYIGGVIQAVRASVRGSSLATPKHTMYRSSFPIPEMESYPTPSSTETLRRASPGVERARTRFSILQLF